jgi:very-short-patch-repair endonuclease
VPDMPQVAVPKDRRLDPEARAGIQLIWRDLGDHDVEGLCTTREKTLEICGRRLPFDEALAVFDSALRHGFSRTELGRLSESARGPGSARLRRVAGLADHRAANPFESVLRAIALDVPGLRVEPQVRIRGELGLDVRPDLMDRRRRIVLEADSFGWHGDRSALRRDSRRYDLLVVNGWVVLRFSWEDVMHDQAWVRTVLASAVERTERCSVGAEHA